MMDQRTQKLRWLLIVLLLLLLTCEAGDRAAACPEMWAQCSDREDFRICKSCVLVSEATTLVARFGRFEDCATGWESRVAVSLGCSFEER